MALLRVLVFAFIGLSVVYWLMAIYARSTERERLEKKWDAAPPEGDADRDAFVAAGMAVYEKSLRRKLIWLVYVVPLAVVAVIIYIVNAQ
jgi:Mg2+/citrate symporter